MAVFIRSQLASALQLQALHSEDTTRPCVAAAAAAGVRGSDFVCFYDWEDGRLVRRIDVGAVKNVIWSDNGELVAIAGDASFYVLQVVPSCCLVIAMHLHVAGLVGAAGFTTLCDLQLLLC